MYRRRHSDAPAPSRAKRRRQGYVATGRLASCAGKPLQRFDVDDLFFVFQVSPATGGGSVEKIKGERSIYTAQSIGEWVKLNQVHALDHPYAHPHYIFLTANAGSFIASSIGISL